MMERLVARCFLIFLVTAMVGFDSHLVRYCPGTASCALAGDAFPGHNDLPVKDYGHHEDITLKYISVEIPSPPVRKVHACCLSDESIPPIPLHSVWQPPEIIL